MSVTSWQFHRSVRIELLAGLVELQGRRAPLSRIFMIRDCRFPITYRHMWRNLLLDVFLCPQCLEYLDSFNHAVDLFCRFIRSTELMKVAYSLQRRMIDLSGSIALSWFLRHISCFPQQPHQDRRSARCRGKDSLCSRHLSTP